MGNRGLLFRIACLEPRLLNPPNPQRGIQAIRHRKLRLSDLPAQNQRERNQAHHHPLHRRLIQRERYAVGVGKSAPGPFAFIFDHGMNLRCSRRESSLPSPRQIINHEVRQPASISLKTREILDQTEHGNSILNRRPIVVIVHLGRLHRPVADLLVEVFALARIPRMMLVPADDSRFWCHAPF